MADARAFAEWVQVNQMQVPVAPEELENPKDQLLALVRRSRSREVKSDLLPAYGSGRLTGPLYAVRLQEFIEKFWDVRRVVKSGRAPSLTRALACLEQAVSSYQGR